MDGDPQAGDKPIDPGGKNDESHEEGTLGLDSVWRDSGRSWISLFGVKPSGNSSLPQFAISQTQKRGDFPLKSHTLLLTIT